MGSAQGICLGGSAKGDGSAWGVLPRGLPRGSA